jgi:Smr domain
MNIGDKVKLTNTTETGIIANILKGERVEVALDGWNSTQVFNKNELTLLSKPVEIKGFGENTNISSYEKGIFLAFVPHKLPNGEGLNLYIINTTEWDLPFAISIEKNDSKAGLMAGFLKSGGIEKCANSLLISNFEAWKNLNISLIYFSEIAPNHKASLIIQKKFHASSFFQNKKKAPILNLESYLFQLDEKPLEINAKEIQEKMFESNVAQETIISQKPATEVDLHIENLTKTYWRLSHAEIFALQLKTFETQLESAIVAGVDKIVFIHGIGEGKLKNALHQKLKEHKNVSAFGKASDIKYGDGATVVKIK